MHEIASVRSPTRPDSFWTIFHKQRRKKMHSFFRRPDPKSATTWPVVGRQDSRHRCWLGRPACQTGSRALSERFFELGTCHRFLAAGGGPLEGGGSKIRGGSRITNSTLPNCKTKIRLQDCRLQDYIDLHRLHAACYNFIRLTAWWPLKGPADIIYNI